MADKTSMVVNVFKCENEKLLKQHFTEVWIKMINSIERGKGVIANK